MSTTAVPDDAELLALIADRHDQVDIGAGEDELADALRAVLVALAYPPNMGPGQVLHSLAVIEAMAAADQGRPARLPGTYVEGVRHGEEDTRSILGDRVRIAMRQALQ